MRTQDLSDQEWLDKCSRGLCWRVGPFAVRLATQLPDLAAQLRFLYGEYPLLSQDAIVDAELSVRTCGLFSRRATIYSDGRPFYVKIPRSQVVPLVEWTLNLCVFHRPCVHLLIHAAVVEKEGRALILPGEAGSGKSTLCAALMHRGWRLLSDEVAVVRRADGMLLPAPRPVSLKEDSIEVIRRFARNAVLGPTWPETPKGRLAHLPPPPEWVRRMDEIAEPAWIVFPTFTRGIETSLTPFSKGRTALWCAAHSFNYSTLGREGFRAMTKLADSCDCYSLSFSNLESALAELEGITRSAPAHELATSEHVS